MLNRMRPRHRRLIWTISVIIVSIFCLNIMTTFILHISLSSSSTSSSPPSTMSSSSSSSSSFSPSFIHIPTHNNHAHDTVQSIFNSCIADGYSHSSSLTSSLGYNLYTEVSEPECRLAILERYCHRASGQISPLETLSSVPSTSTSSTVSPLTLMLDNELTQQYRSWIPKQRSVPIPQLRLAYIILSHGRPTQLFRLLKAIYDARDVFYIHMDSNSNATDWNELRGSEWSRHSNVILDMRYAILWGGSGLMFATLHGIRTLLQTQYGGWQFVINLSQSDYPFASPNEIRRNLHSRLGYNFLSIQMDAASRAANAGYHDMVECGSHMYRIGDARLLSPPLGIEYHRGGQWWILSRPFVTWMMKSRVVTLLTELLAHSPMPDERLFQTAFMMSPFKNFGVSFNYRWQLGRKIGVNESRCDEDRVKIFVGLFWCGTGPRWINRERGDLDALIAGPHTPLFVRKMHPVISSSALEWIDEAREQQHWKWKAVPASTFNQMASMWKYLTEIAFIKWNQIVKGGDNATGMMECEEDDKENGNGMKCDIQSISILEQQHIVSYDRFYHNRVYQCNVIIAPRSSSSTIQQQYTMSFTLDALLSGWVSGRLLSHGIGSEHDRDRLAVHGRLWIIVANTNFWAQQTWLPAILSWTVHVEIIPSFQYQYDPNVNDTTLSPYEDIGEGTSCHTLSNKKAVATMKLNVEAGWRFTWTQFDGLQTGMYAVRVTQLGRDGGRDIPIGYQCLLIVGDPSLTTLRKGLLHRNPQHPLSIVDKMFYIDPKSIQVK